MSMLQLIEIENMHFSFKHHQQTVYRTGLEDMSVISWQQTLLKFFSSTDMLLTDQFEKKFQDTEVLRQSDWYSWLHLFTFILRIESKDGLTGKI